MTYLTPEIIYDCARENTLCITINGGGINAQLQFHLKYLAGISTKKNCLLLSFPLTVIGSICPHPFTYLRHIFVAALSLFSPTLSSSLLSSCVSLLSPMSMPFILRATFTTVSLAMTLVVYVKEDGSQQRLIEEM